MRTRTGWKPSSTCPSTELARLCSWPSRTCLPSSRTRPGARNRWARSWRWRLAAKQMLLDLSSRSLRQLGDHLDDVGHHELRHAVAEERAQLVRLERRARL